MSKKIKLGIICGTSTIIVLALFFSAYIYSLKNIKAPAELTIEQQTELNTALDSAFHERLNIVHPLPYSTIPAELSISAQNAILIDTLTGSVLYEKNADAEVPPASMTKLVVMYIVFSEIEQGRHSLDEIVPLPPECWARNLPSDSSIMFLDQGQNATIKDLLSGLAVASGNDAAIAIAIHLSGTVQDFVARMNKEVKALGLKHTHFAEPSGYSEENITTPREFAAFSRIYLQKFPYSLEMFHSQKSFVYPKEQNLPAWQKSNPQKYAITLYNTNKLLWHLEGCDGLKTGFIYESGYNLTLTAKRGDTRFLSVTMHGAGIGAAQGNKHKIEDGTTLMEWAFSHFADYKNENVFSFTVAVPGGKSNSVNLVPALQPNNLTVPFITGSSPKEASENVKVHAELPPYIPGKTTAGEVYGKLVYTCGETVLQTIPLAADRTIKKAGFPVNIAGKLALLFL